MKYETDEKRNRAIASAPSRNRTRTGQSMTSLLVGIAIMGCVGAGAAKLMQSTHTQEQSLSARSGAAELMDTIAGEIRTQTRYSDLVSKYGGTGDSGARWKTIGGDNADTENDEFIVRTTVRKICNDAPSTNCDATHVDIEVVDKNTGETVLKQTVSRVYTHFEEPAIAFVSSQSPEFPPDAIAMRYVVEGGGGNNGTTYDGHGYLLKINSAACPYDQKPNSTSPRPNGCVACPSPTWKQYRNGDCSLFTCPTGQKANAAGNGCATITCPSGQALQGDNCVTQTLYISVAWETDDCRIGDASFSYHGWRGTVRCRSLNINPRGGWDKCHYICNAQANGKYACKYWYGSDVQQGSQ